MLSVSQTPSIIVEITLAIDEETEIHGVHKILCVKSHNHDLNLAVTPKPKSPDLLLSYTEIKPQKPSEIYP